ncbi:MAG: tryptophan synthase subunit beta [Bacteriovoracaceae bacterium]
MKTNNKAGRFGEFGGQYVPETLMEPLIELEAAYLEAISNPHFQQEFHFELKTFVGRETPLYLAKNLSREFGSKIYLKREDLNHTGSHKINNSLGQILLAMKMKKTRIIAETGAGQHGVATACVAARFGLECVVYMGRKDYERQISNVKRMKLLGATVVPVESGAQTLKDAVSEAMRDWVSNIKNSYYILGSALGPHPYPTMVAYFQSVIGIEARKQILEYERRLPHELIACVGGGSNAIGLFGAFLKDPEVKMFGVEAGGVGNQLGEHAARFKGGKIGAFQGTMTYVLQDQYGQISETNSISAGLDYAAIGPEHSFLKETGRVHYDSANDQEALNAFIALTRKEGIIPALESSHALAFAFKRAQMLPKNSIIIVNLSGRGDKDLDIVGVQHV